MPTVFVSHIKEEAALADGLKRELEKGLAGASFFTSSSDIRLGEPWMDRLRAELDAAELVIVLCSPRSLRRPWINFEAGAGYGLRKPVVPLCHSGLRHGELPRPFSDFEAFDLINEKSCRALVQQLAGMLKDVTVRANFDPAAMWLALDGAPATGTRRIGIDWTHGQDQWAPGNWPDGIFELPASAVELAGAHDFAQLQDVSALASDLRPLSGLVLGIPHKRRIDPEDVATIVAWVKRGGRLLLLGFELGDAHHGSNLNDVGRAFGIHFSTDIVGPPDLAKQAPPATRSVDQGSIAATDPTVEKPYGDLVTFDVAAAEPHPLNRGLESVKLMNVQTVSVVPGGIEWLRVGRNLVCRPSREYVTYIGGALEQRRSKRCDAIAELGRLAVAVEAPAQLCGTGGVVAIGTWQIFDKGRRDNDELVSRLLAWLAGGRA